MKTTVPTYYSEEKKRWKKKWPFGRKLIPDKNSIYQMFYFGQKYFMGEYKTLEVNMIDVNVFALKFPQLLH